MDRYRQYGGSDDPSGSVGDVSLLGIDQYSTPENIREGYVQAAINTDFSTQDASTRKGFVGLQQLGSSGLGMNWDLVDSVEVLDWVSVTYGSGLFVAVASDAGSVNRVMTSPDGETWTIRSASVIAAWVEVRYIPLFGCFIAVGVNTVIKSTDGITWTNVSPVSLGTPTGITINGQIAAGNKVWTSSNLGVTWTSQNKTFNFSSNIQYTEITQNDSYTVALTLNGSLIYINLNGVTSYVFNILGIYGRIFATNNYAIARKSTEVVVSPYGFTAGESYQSYPFSNLATDITGFAYATSSYGSKYVVVGTNVVATTSTIYADATYYNWVENTNVPAGVWKGLASNGSDTFVAVGSAGKVMRSAPVTGVIYASSVYTDSTDLSSQWIMLVSKYAVSFYCFGRSPRSVSYNSQTVSEQSTIVQCNNLVYLFRGADDTPLTWNGDWNALFELAPTPTPLPGFEIIPNSNQATYYQDRLWVKNGKDIISASDIGDTGLDFNTYDALANAFKINSGSSDFIVTTFPFGKNSLMVFKNRSILILENVDGSLGDVSVSEVTRQVGCIGINAITSIGPDLAYVSNQNINLITLTSTNNSVQHKTLPLSSRIQTLMNQVNWQYGYKISITFFDNKLWVALPMGASEYCDTVVVYNFVTESWFGEWNFNTDIDMRIQGWQIINYQGVQRLHAVCEDGKIYVTEEGYQDIARSGVDTTVYDIASSVTTRAYNLSNLNHYQRRLFVDISTNRPSYSVSAFTEGASEETVLLTDQTYARSESFKFGDSNYDMTNADDDFNRAYRKDYSSGCLAAGTTQGQPSDGLQCGTGFQPELPQDLRLPLGTRRQGRLSWIQVSNTEGTLIIRGLGFEARAGQRSSLIQV